MNAMQEMKSGSSIEQQLCSINTFELQHDATLHDARVARIRFLVDAIVWIGNKLQRADAGVLAKTDLKY